MDWEIGEIGRLGDWEVGRWEIGDWRLQMSCGNLDGSSGSFLGKVGEDLGRVVGQGPGR